MSYGGAGFTVGGSVNGDYSTEDVQRSYDSKTDKSIRPNVVSEEVTQILNVLELLAAGNPTTETFSELSTKCQAVLSGDRLDPIKAVIIPLETVDAVHSIFVDSPGYEVECSFCAHSCSVIAGTVAMTDVLCHFRTLSLS